MIRCEIEDTKKIDVYANSDLVEMYFTDEADNVSVIEMSRELLTRLMKALNKIERRI